MKKIVIISALIFTIPLLTFGQDVSTGKDTGKTNVFVFRQSKKILAAKQKVMAVEQELADAIVKGNISAFENNLADTFFFSAPDGTTHSKEQFLSDLKSGAFKMESTINEGMNIQIYGDTAAVVTYISTDKGKYKDNDISGKYRWTNLFIKQNGGWKLVSTQGTPILKRLFRNRGGSTPPNQ
jgi:ketosteroid isomerase-like protein